MQPKNHKLIAFNDLERMIIQQGFCTVCGACEAACPIHAIKVEHEKPQRLYDCSEHIDTCPICYDICPHTDALIYEALRFVADAPKRRENLGYYREILLAQAANPSIRAATKSGGVVNALLNFAISEKIIDGAITSKASPATSLKAKPSISLAPDDMLSAVGSKIVPSAVAQAYGRAVFEHGKTHIAFVGIPCHVLGLRKLEAWQHKIIDGLEIIIGLFCLWGFSLSTVLEFLLDEYHIAVNEIQSVDLSADAYIVNMENRQIRVPISKVKSHILNRCKTCVDFTSEYADLSIGGASPLKEWSIVIIRTRKGEEFFNKALTSGIIITKNVEEEPQALAHLIQLAAHKRKSALQEMKTMRERGVYVPATAELFVRPRPSEFSLLERVNVEQIMTKNVVTLPPTLTISQFFKKIAEHHHIGFPVINESGKIIGIVTLQDAMKIPEEKRNNVSIGEIYTKKLITIYPNNSVAEALEKMDKHNVGRLLVFDKNDKLVGILTRSDIMHLIRKTLY
ncbi:CBS domain-containing protein [Candidatus Bathyarchaeota archaeon]|nr:CBS domain-containing protein [Candidatus Bathyarchaeota archaeon]